jgi:chorismate dehydratase
MMHGPQRDLVDLSFAVPSVCADRVVAGEADLGIIPAIEMARHGFDYVPGVGIACRGPVRSIFLVSKVPFDRIGTLATDTGSRTSVELARIVLRRRYGADPRLLPMAPDLTAMLAAADACLLIGDAALAIDPSELDHPHLDLGEEWVQLTGLPMVFAVWSGRREAMQPGLDKLFGGSCRYGLANLDRIIAEETQRRGFSESLVNQYLTRHIVFQLGEAEQEGLRTFLRYAAELDSSIQLQENSPLESPRC